MHTIEQAVREFDAQVRADEQVIDSLAKVFSSQPECALNDAIWGLVTGYINALEAAHGIGQWLEWWWLECHLGTNPLHASLGDEDLRTIATIDDLVKLVCDDLVRLRKISK